MNEGNELYLKRLKHLVQFEINVVPDIKNTKNMPVDELKTKEGLALLKQVGDGDKLCLLDENGTTFTSEKFADFIDKLTTTGTKQLIFVVGGAYGFSQEVYGRADYKISLSKMTFSHQIIRVIFLEQIYRAYTIIKGIPYHNQ
ncbi:MAG: 23S rRNA (pseudouridine(1915)-N(3))-methyltransferase RlmH [Chloroflexia bacterium]|nr:23S rRNA (pseudouridine(1915)-N(3))-methyltransferase RlmH [Chloroflexia bacterium]